MVARRAIVAFLGVFSALLAYACLLAVRFAVVEGLWAAVVMVVLAGVLLVFAWVKKVGPFASHISPKTADRTWRVFLAIWGISIPAMLVVGHYFLGGAGTDYRELFEIAVAALNGQPNPHPENYGANPHNHFLLMCMVVLFRMVYFFVPAASESILLWVHVVLNIVCIETSYLLVALTARKLWGKFHGALCGIAMALYAPLWTSCSNPYSDTAALLFITLALWLVATTLLEGRTGEVRKSKRFYTCCIGLGLVCAIGFKIKATVAIVLVAFVLVAFVCMRAKQALSALVCIALAFLLGIGACNAFIEAVRPAVFSYTAQQRYEQKFPYAHWAMMGLNVSTQGMFNWNDYWYTYGSGNLDEKNAADFAVIQQRLETMGVQGMLHHIFVTKTNKQWALGALLNESIFYRLSTLEDAEGGQWQQERTSFSTAFMLYRNYAQAYHILLLAGMALCGVLFIAKRKEALASLANWRAGVAARAGTEARTGYADVSGARVATLLALMLAVFGFGLFLCGFWEVKPRYLLHFAPLFILITGGMVAQDSVCYEPNVVEG